MAKDYTKYNWYKNGRSDHKLAKNQLVWSIINDYIKSNHITQYAQLATAFPDSIRAGKRGLRGYKNPMFVTRKQSLTHPDYIDRFYDASDKTFLLQNTSGDFEHYVVNKNWGLPLDGEYNCWQEFLDTAEAFGYEITNNGPFIKATETATTENKLVNTYTVNKDMETYEYPVVREGNAKNPKLVILLCNPGGDSTDAESHPEYYMNQDGVYKDIGMKISDLRKYCPWWEKLLTKIESDKLTDQDILCLEYYPYPSPNGSYIPDFSKWDAYAKKANAENAELIKNFVKQGVIIYGFYVSSGWYKMPEIKKLLLNYPKYYTTKNGFLSPKIKHLVQVLRNNGL